MKICIDSEKHNYLPANVNGFTVCGCGKVVLPDTQYCASCGVDFSKLFAINNSEILHTEQQQYDEEQQKIALQEQQEQIAKETQQLQYRKKITENNKYYFLHRAGYHYWNCCRNYIFSLSSGAGSNSTGTRSTRENPSCCRIKSQTLKAMTRKSAAI